MPSDSSRLLAERYRLVSVLGKGGVGTVWRAEDLVLNRAVAVKEVRLPDSLPAAELDRIRDRLLRETRAAARLRHPDVVTVYDVIQEDGRPFVVMELVDAPTLHDVVENDGPLAPERAAAVGLRLLDALEAAHRAGIVHRDVKPANVMLGPGDRVKLADFGVSAVQGDLALRGPAMLLGSPAYMAPEQVEGSVRTPSADLWALGATLYYAVEGVPPFERDGGVAQLVEALLYDQPRRPQRAGRLETALLGLLSKSPETRPSGARLRRLLHTAAGRSEVLSSTTAAGALGSGRSELSASTDQSNIPPAAAEREPTRTQAQTRRQRLQLAATVLASLLTLTGVVLVALGLRSAGPDTGTAAIPADGSQATASAPGGDPDQTEIPEGWQLYRNPDAGYQLAYPGEWAAEPVTADQAHRFLPPGTDAWVQVASQPPGQPPLEQLATAEQRLLESQDGTGYQRVELGAGSYGDRSAAVWEYTVLQDDRLLRARAVVFTESDRTYRLLLRAPDAEWADYQEQWAVFERSFTVVP